MKNRSGETLTTLGYLVFGMAGAIAAGYLIYQHRVFRVPQPFFLLLTVGLTGTLVYAAYRLRGLGYALLMVAVMYLGQLVLLYRPPLRSHYLVEAAIFTVPVGTAFILSAWLYQRYAKLRFGRFVIMGVLVGLGYLVMITVFLARAHVPATAGILWAQTFIGLKMGAGIGLGVELADIISAPAKRPADDLGTRYL